MLRVRAADTVTLARAVRVAVASAVACALLPGCPAQEIDDPNNWDVMPYDAVALEVAPTNPSGPPTCSPEAILDMNALGQRNGNVLTLRVNTTQARNDVHPTCDPDDAPEVVIRYHVPPLTQATVQAVRFTTITDATIANGSGNAMQTVPDPTDFDTVLSLRLACDARDIDCDNDAFFQDANGQAVTTRRSTVYQVDTHPEDVMLLVVDGYAGSAGSALVTAQEYAQLGVLGAPCIPIPLARANDPTAPTAYFRCPHPGVQCLPSAAPDGTDLCVPVVPLGGRCDAEHRFDVCDREDEGVVCAQNPSVPSQIVCAAPGTAPGAPCRGISTSTDRCDAGLWCSISPEADLPDTCVPIREAGESCDPTPKGAINHCDTGLQCCATAPDAGAETECMPTGSPNCFPPPPGG